MTCDGIQFGTWNNVTIDGNVIDGVADFNNSGVHNDGIQFTGNTENATITNNLITGVTVGQGMLIQSSVGVVDNVLVENNLIYNIGVGGSGGFAIQNGATHAVFLNNTSNCAIVLRAGYNGAIISDSVKANNAFPEIGYLNGASSAYEDYNYTQSGYASGTGPHDVFGTSPGYVNSGSGNYHPGIGSPLFGAGVHSFSATVDGVVTIFNAPATDHDSIAQTNPPVIGAYATTAGNSSIAYSGFNYSTTGHVGSLTDGAADYGWVETTWANTDSIVSPGLTYSSLPVLGLALSFSSNIPATRTINTADFPTGYGVVGTDGITRLGATGTTVWVSFLLNPTQADTGNTLTACVSLLGIGTGGGTKLSIGDLGTAGAGHWAISDPAYGGGSIASSVPIAQNTVTLLVAEIQFVAGTNNDVVKLWVNPPLGQTPPATPDATLTGHDISPFGVVEFMGSRASIGDELSVGTSWLSVTSGGL